MSAFLVCLCLKMFITVQKILNNSSTSRNNICKIGSTLRFYCMLKYLTLVCRDEISSNKFSAIRDCLILLHHYPF